jgi:hypothetical protein
MERQMKTPEETKCGLECIRTNAERVCVKPEKGQCPRCEQLVGEGLSRIQQLEAELAAVKRERDAAVKDISRGSRCSVCKKFFKNNDGVGCSGGVYCIPLNFEWRGVCPENTEVQDNA